MNIRPETPFDYAAIAAVHARAFGHRAAEPVVVALRRQFSSFDPDLSLAAEVEGRIVGHVLFSPESIRLAGRGVRAVNLAPIAVDPAHQGQGIGAALINEGHAVARAKGYTVSFLLGEPGYYSRFGYRSCAFGAASAVATAGSLLPGNLHARAITEEDVPALRALWLHEERNVDFAIDPGPDLLGWLSPNPLVRSAVYTRAGAVAGYVRVHAQEPLAPRIFLAQDEQAARAIAGDLVKQSGVISPREIVLPLHPSSASARAFLPPVCQAWDAGMACALLSGALDEYYGALSARERIPGAPVWPVVFDLA